jgi:non-specific serine/threonine protein kinase
MGKTRLAIEVARRARTQFPDGVWLVELAEVADPALVPEAVGLAVGVREEADRPLLVTLVGALGRGRVLLVLDNCEHLVAPCAALTDSLLRACPRLRIMATSREPLGVPGETDWPVPPLTLPPLPAGPASHRSSPGSTEHAAAYEAVRLFAARAAASSPGFAMTDRTALTVTEICRRLDGMPLAIELAAARVKTLGTDQIAARLKDRFRLLASGFRTASPRHQTLRALVDWSYDLLAEEERALLRRLTVFTGGFDLRAAEAVSGDLDPEDAGQEGRSVADLLARLVEKSLVQAVERDGGMRYRLLETIRQYGLEKLRETGDEPLLRERHAAYYVALAEMAAPELRGPNTGAWLARLEREHENLRSALDWALAGGRAECGLRLAVALWQFWYTSGYLSEGQRWLATALARSGQEPAPLRAQALAAAGTLAQEQGQYERAVALCRESLVLFRSLRDTRGVARSLRVMGVAATFQGEHAAARAYLEESLGLVRKEGRPREIASVLTNLGTELRSEGDYEAARACYDEGLGLFRDLGHTWGVAIVLMNLAVLAHLEADDASATELARESLALLWEEGFRYFLPRGLELVGAVAAARGRSERAARLFGAAEALRETIGHPLPPSDRAIYDGGVAAVRAALDETVVRAAWQEGRALPLEQVIQEALETGECGGGGAARNRNSRDGAGPSRSAGGLTPREWEVAGLVAQGLSNRQIAERLVISKPTADRHVSNTLAKLGLSTRAQIAVWVVEQGHLTASA